MEKFRKELQELLNITKTVRKMTDNAIKSAMKLNRWKSIIYNTI